MYLNVGPVYPQCTGTVTTSTATTEWATATPVEFNNVEYTCEVSVGDGCQGEQGPPLVKPEFPRVQRTPNAVRTRSMRRPHRPPGGWGFYR